MSLVLPYKPFTSVMGGAGGVKPGQVFAPVMSISTTAVFNNVEPGLLIGIAGHGSFGNPSLNSILFNGVAGSTPFWSNGTNTGVGYSVYELTTFQSSLTLTITWSAGTSRRHAGLMSIIGYADTTHDDRVNNGGGDTTRSATLDLTGQKAVVAGMSLGASGAGSLVSGAEAGFQSATATDWLGYGLSEQENNNSSYTYSTTRTRTIIGVAFE